MATKKAGDQLDVLKVSVSSLKTYKDCPRKYYYNYILKPEIVKRDWAHLILGNFIHEVLEFFHNIMKKDLSRDRKRMMTFACRTKENEKDKKGNPKYILTPELKKEVKDILTAYLQYLQDKGMPDVQANEKKFNIDLSGMDENLYFADEVINPLKKLISIFSKQPIETEKKPSLTIDHLVEVVKRGKWFDPV